MTKCSLTIDASVLAVPSIDSTSVEVEDYFKSIFEIRALIKSPWCKLYMSEGLTYTLGDLYPRWKNIKKLLEVHNLSKEFSLKDIFEVFSLIFDEKPYFEDKFKMSNVTIGTIKTNPDIFSNSNTCIQKIELERIVTFVAILKKFQKILQVPHYILLKKVCGSKIIVDVYVESLKTEDSAILALLNPPKKIECDVEVCSNFGELVNCLDEIHILKTSTDNLGIKFAVHIALFKHDYSNKDKFDWDNINMPIIGNSFYKKFREQQQNDDYLINILATVVITAMKKQLNDVKEIPDWTGRKQKTRSGDKAYYRELTGKFVLTFWECLDGKIELASVNKPGDLSIPK